MRGPPRPLSAEPITLIAQGLAILDRSLDPLPSRLLRRIGDEIIVDTG